MLIRGKRVTIRNFELSDFDDYYEFSKHPDVGYNAGWKPHPNQEISRKILHSNIMSSTIFALELNDTGKVIGSIELNPSHIRERVRAFEIGFALNPDYWGHGYASEATRLMLGYAFNKMHALVCEMCHIVDNKRCERVALNTGFRYEGTLRIYKEMYDKRIVDVKLYSMTFDEYERMYE